MVIASMDASQLQTYNKLKMKEQICPQMNTRRSVGTLACLHGMQMSYLTVEGRLSEVTHWTKRIGHMVSADDPLQYLLPQARPKTWPIATQLTGDSI
eukprot:COSAG02_NODE_1545_length_11996_cov_6.889636_12_plen_97_part_00